MAEFDEKRAYDIMSRTALRLTEGKISLGKDFREIALPVWKKMVHEIVIDQCPCQKGHEDCCILTVDDQTFRDACKKTMLDFYKFVGMIEGVYEKIYSIILEGEEPQSE